MRIKTQIVCVTLLTIFLAAGCAKQADSNKPIERIQKEVAGMSVSQLESSARAYAKEIAVQKTALGKIQTQLKQLSPADLLGDKAQGVKKDVSKVAAQIKALTQRYDIYASKYRELGGDLSKIKIG